MDSKKPSGAKIRKDFIDFFVKRGHTFVPSSSLVPGGDQTLLFTNAGMVQFKDVFLGIDKRPYSRATNSQKCMRVAGKHNDLDDVGRDDTHHTFFEMLGNWSFGDYYKEEAIAWAWELLTDIWGLPKDKLWATCFRDEKGEIPEDSEAAEIWLKQPDFDPTHLLFFGRKDNFWEMAETGPSGPCSEIHIDRGAEFCNKKDVPGHICQVNGDCQRFLELWNLVFIQYNRLNPSQLESLAAKHIDTGMGFERIVSVLQNVDSNYKTDLLAPLMDKVQQLTGDTDEQRITNMTPYRVIADHARASTFLIADGVVPGNLGRNYVTRMIIRRAARFGKKIGLDEPFLAIIADKVIEIYGDFYPEVVKNKSTILDNITREEKRFSHTLESGISKLETTLSHLDKSNQILSGEEAFDLYATYGLPLEITRDILREQGYEVDEAGFFKAMEKHRLASGAGETFGSQGGEDVEIYHNILLEQQGKGNLDADGVRYDPYEKLQVTAPVLAIIRNGQSVQQAKTSDRVEILLPETCFYIESGGQVSDTGIIQSNTKPYWEIRITGMRKPAAGMIVHIGEVVEGTPTVGDIATAQVDTKRRQDIMRNHTATHLLHAALREVLGEHARQAGSLVAPDHLRFDFTHPEALTSEQLENIEAIVNETILNDYQLNIRYKTLQEALDGGAIALFGEKYGDTVRNITIGDKETISNELCGGTHVEATGDIGLFLIISEGSAAAGIRRIEAVTGRGAYQLAKKHINTLNHTAKQLSTTPDNVPNKVFELQKELSEAQKHMTAYQKAFALHKFEQQLDDIPLVENTPVLSTIIPDVNDETLRELVDSFKQRFPSGVIALATITASGKPLIIAGITKDLTERGLNAGDLVKFIAQPLGGGGGGRPTLAQAGGKDVSKLDEAMASVQDWVRDKFH